MKIYSHDYYVGVGECDLFSRLRSGPLLRFVQHAETAHCMGTPLSREALLADMNGIWVLSRLKVRLLRPISWKETLTIKTYHRGAQGALLTRDCLFFAGQEPVGGAASGWVVVDFDDRHILRSSTVAQRMNFRLEEPLMEEIPLGKLRPRGTLSPCGLREIRYSDLDYNLHLNHTVYGDIVCDALQLQEKRDRFVSQLQINFLKETRCGETLELFSDGEEDCYVAGLVGGEKRFEAQAVLSPCREK